MGFRGSRVQIPPSRLELAACTPPLVIVLGNSSARFPQFSKQGSRYIITMNGSPAAAIRPADLLQLWQQRADYLHQFGDPNSARLWHTARIELERALEAFGAVSWSTRTSCIAQNRFAARRDGRQPMTRGNK